MLVVLAGLLIPYHHPVCHLGQPLGGEPRHRVGLMHRRGDAPAGRGVDHGVGGIPPRPHHQIGLEGVQDAGGLPLGDRKVAEGSQVVLDARGRKLRQKELMVTVSRGKPSFGTSRSSMPPLAPTNRT